MIADRQSTDLAGAEYVAHDEQIRPEPDDMLYGSGSGEVTVPSDEDWRRVIRGLYEGAA